MSHLVQNLSEGLDKIKCKSEHDDKKWETCGTKYKFCDCFLECINFKDDLTQYKCWNKIYQQKFNENFKENFFNTYKFCNHDNNKFILLLRKSVYSYEYIDHWEKVNKISLPEKEDVFSQLNMENITDADYAHAKRICKDLEIK